MGAASTVIYPLSLHDALPICIGRFEITHGQGDLRTAELLRVKRVDLLPARGARPGAEQLQLHITNGEPHARPTIFLIQDRKSTRLNSSHLGISYAVFCLKKKI